MAIRFSVANIGKKESGHTTEFMNNNKNTKHQKTLSYNFFYWGPLLFKVELDPADLKACLKLCSKKSSEVNDTLAGVIKHQHYVSSQKFYKAIESYLVSFRHCYNQWYGKPLSHKIKIDTAWVNFMTAGEFNPPHIHEGCDFSSVLFVKIPKKLREENKKFTGTAQGPGSISFTYGESQKYSISQKDSFPQAGDLFIFPATLTHFVAPFMSQGERISISANFKFE